MKFKIDIDKYYVNVTPDKRVLMIHQEAELVAQVRDVLEKLFESTYTMGKQSNKL